jgi:hypothetical protein
VARLGCYEKTLRDKGGEYKGAITEGGLASGQVELIEMEEPASRLGGVENAGIQPRPGAI